MGQLLQLPVPPSDKSAVSLLSPEWGRLLHRVLRAVSVQRCSKTLCSYKMDEMRISWCFFGVLSPSSALLQPFRVLWPHRSTFPIPPCLLTHCFSQPFPSSCINPAPSWSSGLIFWTSTEIQERVEASQEGRKERGGVQRAHQKSGRAPGCLVLVLFQEAPCPTGFPELLEGNSQQNDLLEGNTTAKRPERSHLIHIKCSQSPCVARRLPRDLSSCLAFLPRGVSCWHSNHKMPEQLLFQRGKSDQAGFLEVV